MNRPSLLLSITGTRCSGKDTLASHFKEFNPKVVLFSFAYAVRTDLYDFIRQHYNLDVFTASGRAKEICRGFLLAHGAGMRQLDPEYWIKKTALAVQCHLVANPDAVVCLTDCRYRNEAHFFRAAYGSAFKLINVTRDGAPEPTDEEKRHYRDVVDLADLHLNWGGDDEASQRAKAREIAAKVGLI